MEGSAVTLCMLRDSSAMNSIISCTHYMIVHTHYTKNQRRTGKKKLTCVGDVAQSEVNDLTYTSTTNHCHVVCDLCLYVCEHTDKYLTVIQLRKHAGVGHCLEFNLEKKVDRFLKH